MFVRRTVAVLETDLCESKHSLFVLTFCQQSRYWIRRSQTLGTQTNMKGASKLYKLMTRSE